MHHMNILKNDPQSFNPQRRPATPAVELNQVVSQNVHLSHQLYQFMFE